MNAYIYFFEDYIELIIDILLEVSKEYDKPLSFRGLAARRKGICTRLNRCDDLDIQSYDWLNNLEEKWLRTPVAEGDIEFCESLIGTRNIRHLIYGDRELGHGFLFGGTYARTDLRTIVEANPEKRWNYVVNMLKYYHGEFSNNSTDLVFFIEFTMTYELGAFFMAEALGIATCSLAYSRLKGRIFVKDDPWRSLPRLNAQYDELLEDPTIIHDDYIVEAKQYIASFRAKPLLPKYSEVSSSTVPHMDYLKKSMAGLLSLSSKWKKGIKNLLGKRDHLHQRYSLDVLKIHFNSLWAKQMALYGACFDDFAKYKNSDFIYFPLHVEPEASLLVSSSKMTNQLTVIEQIAKSMPAGYKLLVKEHIPCLGLRPKGFYNKIKKIPDVYLISPYVDGFEVLKLSKLVVTITGTVGWEAIVLGEAALVLGETEYKYFNEGAVFNNDLMGMEDTIKKAMLEPPADEDKLVLFLAAALNVGVDLSLDAFLYAHYGEKLESSKRKNDHRAIKKMAHDILLRTESKFK